MSRSRRRDQPGQLGQPVGAALNPTRHTAETVRCPACHLATVLVPARASVAGVNPATVPARFTSPYDLSNPNGIAPDNERSLRAFGSLPARGPELGMAKAG